MKVFKFKFSKLITVLIYVAIALCFIGIGINVYFIATKGIDGAADPVYPIIQYTMMFLVTGALAVILISILVSSKYTVEKDGFTTHFGIVKSNFKLVDIEKIVLDRNKNKLSVYFKNGEYIVIVVSEEWYNEFVESVLENGNNIDYEIISKQN